MHLRRSISRSKSWWARLLRGAYKTVWNASLPAPRVVVLPIAYSWGALQYVYYFLKCKLLCEPFLKARCTKYGKRLRAGNFVHWIYGSGDIVCGDDVRIDGKVDIGFSTILPKRPRLEIGNRTYVGHRTSFTIASRVSIGDDVYIAGDVKILDSPGHPVEPEMRLAKLSPGPDQVRPITIGNNVWIATSAIIMPGVNIGEGSVIGAGSVVTRDVPSNSLAVGVPAKVVRDLSSNDSRPGLDSGPVLPHR